MVSIYEFLIFDHPIASVEYFLCQYRRLSPTLQYVTCEHGYLVASNENFSPNQDFHSHVIIIEIFLCMGRGLLAPVLEIGTFIGFSGMGWSHAVGNQGHVTTLEFDPKYAAVAQEAFDKYGVANVEIIVGDARES